MMNLQNNDNNNTSAYVKSMDEEEDIMQRAMEEKRNDNIRKSYATEQLLQELSPTAKRYYKIFRLLEPPQEKRRLFYKYINIFASMYMGVLSAANFQYIPEKGVQSVFKILNVVHGYCYIFVIPLTIHKIYFFYEDGGEYFYTLFMDLPLEKRKQGLRELKKLNRFLNIGGSLLLLTSVPPIAGPLLVHGAVAPMWFLVSQWIWIALFFHFIVYGGFRCFIFCLYHISLVSSCAVQYIESISKKYYEAFVIKYDVEDGNNENIQKAKVDKLTLEFERVERSLRRAYKIFPFPFFQCTLIVACYILAAAADEIINVMNGVTPNIAFLVVLEVMEFYFLKVLLTLSIASSLAYKRFIDDLHKPNMLWSISKLYQGNQGISQYFFDGLNRHRHKLIWILAGVEMTSDIYKKISISLFTIIITALIYSIRGSYFM